MIITRIRTSDTHCDDINPRIYFLGALLYFRALRKSRKCRKRQRIHDSNSTAQICTRAKRD